MSNQRHRKAVPPKVVFAAGREVCCPDCSSPATGPRLGADGKWHLITNHDVWCTYVREFRK